MTAEEKAEMRRQELKEKKERREKRKRRIEQVPKHEKDFMEQQQHCFSDSTPRAGSDRLQKSQKVC